MSVKNFIPTIWYNGILQQYDKQMTFAALANRRYEGEISGAGDRVKINEIGPITVNTYAGTSITYEELEDASQYLDIDQKKYAAVTIDDVDRIQTRPDLLGEATRKMAVALSDTVDQYLASKYTEAGITEGTTSSVTSITSTNVTNYLALMSQYMDEKNVPKSGRVAIVPPWFITKMLLAKITKDTNNSAFLANGYFGNYVGFDIYESNNISHSSTTWYAPMFFVAGETIAHAEQLMPNSVEMLRSESTFANKMRALMVYGSKVVRPDSLGVLYCASGAES